MIATPELLEIAEALTALRHRCIVDHVSFSDASNLAWHWWNADTINAALTQESPKNGQI